MSLELTERKPEEESWQRAMREVDALFFPAPEDMNVHKQAQIAAFIGPRILDPIVLGEN